MTKAAFGTFFAVIAFTMGSSCFLNSTHCQCTNVKASGTCLRHFSGSGSFSMCQQYECAASVACDCKIEQRKCICETLRVRDHNHTY
jgi:hypothetical protein